MVHHHVLRAVEWRVENGEIFLESRKIPPMRELTEICVDIVGKDAIEQIPALSVHGQAIEIDNVDDRQNVLVGHRCHSSCPRKCPSR
jgi:hypothetical protein